MSRKSIFVVLAILVLPAVAFAGIGGTRALLPYMNLNGIPAPRTVLADPPQVGDQVTFWGWDLSVMPPTDREVVATCRGVSDYGYVFVEDTLWGTDMTQDDVDNVLEAWDESSPAVSIDPNLGIWDIETQVYGDAPNVDGWPGVVLLYYEIGCFMGQCFDGFYRYDDQVAGAHSNMMDMLHLEGKTSEPGSDYMLGVTAHEFNHMLQMQYDLNEDMWLSESLAEAAMIVTGYPTDIGWLDDFVANPESSFWDSEMDMHYGAALLLGTYLYEYGGLDLVTAVNEDSANGESSIESHLIELELATGFNEFFGDMAAAIAADYFYDSLEDKGIEHYYYDLLEVGELNWTDEIAMADEPFTLDLNIAAGTMQAYKFTMDPDQFNQLAFDFPDNSAAMVEGAMVDLRAPMFGIMVTRFNSAWDSWPHFNSTFHGTNGLLLVVANPTQTDIETSVDINFDKVIESPDDDDTIGDDDTTDDDATDDDVDDDDATVDDDDDDDDDDGCGC